MMVYGDYYIEFDRTGFPLIQFEGWKHFIGLFPVSKYQFERFLAEEGGSRYTDEWYRNILKLNPRRSWRMAYGEIWKLFMTGLDLDVIDDFLNYLGSNYRLPTLDEWKALCEVSDLIEKSSSYLKKLCSDRSPEPVLLWIERGLCPLVNEGIFERIHENNASFVGKPFHGLLPNTWDPKEPKKVNIEKGMGMIGFRVVRE
ncbi:formylglycine-generating enzyme family protein [Methanothermobacter sp. KEPCO-1]|nr:formylglycine-generating enzyme family protein [Methanothermobacter sp. KEPCO-1]